MNARHETLATESAGRIGYYAALAREGRPLLLVHGVSAASSAFEMRPLLEHYRSERPVYVIDLPGFGSSERSDRHYTALLYSEALSALLKQRVGAPADVVALSLSAEFAAAASLAHPESISSLVLVSPTGLSRRALPEPSPLIQRVLRAPILSDSLFALLTTRKSIEYFFGKHFHGTLPRELVDSAHRNAHQPGAKFAPLAFLSFQLFAKAAWRDLYPKLRCPVLVIHDEDPNVSFEVLPDLVATNSNWRTERIRPTRGMPHWEAFEATTEAMDRFWADATTPVRPNSSD